MSLFDDFTTDVNHASRPMTVLPYAWQATADNKVQRHYSASPADAVDTAEFNVRKVQQRIATMNRLFEACKGDVITLIQSVGDIEKALAAPRAELDLAKLEIERLKQQNASIVKEAQRQAVRADAAEKRADELQTIIKDLQAVAAEPGPAAVAHTRHRTPGDAVRYFSSEVMKHAADNLELAGIAIALRMTAADVDNLPQGDHAR